MSEVNVNTASVFELERALHNRERAQEILNKREQFGDFKNWDDLRAKVHGMSDSLVRKLSESGVTVEHSGPSERNVARRGRGRPTTRLARRGSRSRASA